MAYARKGPDSDVYVYHDGSKYVCCMCELSAEQPMFETENLLNLKFHLEEHEEKGQKVPQHSYDRIDSEVREKIVSFVRNFKIESDR